MIRPALFIGLGTTGRDILEYLYELMLEHYGSDTLNKLPIFKFVVFETHEGNITKSKNIEMKHLTITNPGSIKDHLEEKEYLKDWLDMNLLKVSGGKFTTGADNGRMAGKLCLWENWDKVKEVLSGRGGVDRGAKSIIDPKNIDVSEDSLRWYYDKIGKSYDKSKKLIKDQPIVYIVGTLYGGTCSGIFIDIAYFVKDVFGLYANKLPDVNLTPVRGFFTICDSSEIRNASDTQSKRRAANCWSALTEVDFWCHPESEYKVEYPDGTKLETNEDPIDSLYLVSYSGPTVGKPLVSDFETLKHKIALNLFTEVVGDLLAAKDEIKTNTRSVVDLTKPNSNECMRFFGTFGIAAYWYPKYRISQAVACLYGANEICEKWLGTTNIHANRKQELKREAISFCERIIEANKRELTTTDEENKIAQLFADEREIMGGEIAEFEQILRDKLSILAEGGTYDRIVSDDSRRNTLRRRMFEEIEDDIRQKINRIQDGTSTLEEIICYLNQLDEVIKDTINKYPSYSLDAGITSVSDISLMLDGWIKAVRRAKVLKEQEKELIIREKKRVINNCKGYILSQLENLTKYRMREPLKILRQELGIDESLSEDLRRAGYRTIMQKVEVLKNLIVESQEAFVKRAEAVSKGIKTTGDIKIITKSTTIEEDIKDLFALFKTDPKVKSDMMTDILTRDDGTVRHLSEFLQYGIRDISYETIYNSLLDSLTKIALDKVKGFDIAEKVLKSTDLPNIRLFAQQSNPHLELTGDLPSKALAKPPELIMGRSSMLSEFNEKLNDYSAQDRIGFGRIVETNEVDHMLIFYKEEECLFKDTNLASAAIDDLYPKVCDEIEEKVRRVRRGEKKEEVPYTVFTHQIGKNYFDPNIYIRKENAKKLITIAKNIFSTWNERGELIASEIFKSIGNGKERLLKHEFQNPTTRYLDGITGDAKGVEKMGQYKDVFDYFKGLLDKKIREIGEEEFINRVNNYLKWKDLFEEAKGTPQLRIEDILNEERKKYEGLQSTYFPKDKGGLTYEQ